jgi:hypothetical protein
MTGPRNIGPVSPTPLIAVKKIQEFSAERTSSHEQNDRHPDIRW